jgi:hypothetical protein
MRHAFYLFVVPFVLLVAGCFSYGTKESVVQKEDSSSIHLSGEAKGTYFKIDENESIYIKNSDKNKPNLRHPRHLYRVTPGKHRIRIFKSNSLILDKEVFFGTNEIKEISIP